MSLSRFRAQPRKGQHDRAKRIVGYLLFLPDGAIRFRTGEPEFSSLKDQEYDWTRSVYSRACEQIPHDITKPLGKHVQTTHYVDANLHVDLATGKAVTAALHFLNQTPIDAYSKRHHLVSYHRPKRIVGYLLFLPDGAIRFRIGEPDFSSLKDQEYDWTRTVYSGACEQIPHDIPKPLGKHVQTTHYVDANLHHDLATGKAVTAALHFLNQTPIDAYTKRQSTVETATYGSEFVAARTAVDKIIEIRTTLRYLGVPIRDKSYMFGDNRSVVTSSTIPNSTISKRHHLASYHRVREAIAAKFFSFHWKDGKSNPADILSKHWEFATVWPLLKPILFWRGETATQLKGSDRIPSTTPGVEPPRDARDSGSARSHSTHLETSSSNRP